MFPIERETAEIIFDHFGEITEAFTYTSSQVFSSAQEKFLDACRVVQNPVWAAPKDLSP